MKKVSECVTGGVADKATGKRGVLFHTGAIKWLSDIEAEITGGYYEEKLSSSGSTYHLKKVDGKWIVTKDVLNVIS